MKDGIGFGFLFFGVIILIVGIGFSLSYDLSRRRLAMEAEYLETKQQTLMRFASACEEYVRLVGREVENSPYAP